jgi:excisionase family DNA binding protein
MDKLLTWDEAAERLGTTPRHVRRLVFERRIAYRKLGRYVRFFHQWCPTEWCR